MPKPKWLVDHERKKLKVAREPTRCRTCQHYGDIVGQTRYRGRELVNVHQCAIHPKTRNTRYSIICDDYKKR